MSWFPDVDGSSDFVVPPPAMSTSSFRYSTSSGGQVWLALCGQRNRVAFAEYVLCQRFVQASAAPDLRGPSVPQRRLSLSKPHVITPRSAVSSKPTEPVQAARPPLRAFPVAPSYSATARAIEHIPRSHAESIPLRGRSSPEFMVDDSDDELAGLEADLFQAVDSARSRLSELQDEVNVLLSNSNVARRELERADQARLYWQQEALRLRASASAHEP